MTTCLTLRSKVAYYTIKMIDPKSPSAALRWNARCEVLPRVT